MIKRGTQSHSPYGKGPWGKVVVWSLLAPWPALLLLQLQLMNLCDERISWRRKDPGTDALCPPLASWGHIIYNKIFSVIVILICSFSLGYLREI